MTELQQLHAEALLHEDAQLVFMDALEDIGAEYVRWRRQKGPIPAHYTFGTPAYMDDRGRLITHDKVYIANIEFHPNGLICGVTCLLSFWIKHGPELMAHHPITALNLTDCAMTVLKEELATRRERLCFQMQLDDVHKDIRGRFGPSAIVWAREEGAPLNLEEWFR